MQGQQIALPPITIPPTYFTSFLGNAIIAAATRPELELLAFNCLTPHLREFGVNTEAFAQKFFQHAPGELRAIDKPHTGRRPKTAAERKRMSIAAKARWAEKQKLAAQGGQPVRTPRKARRTVQQKTMAAGA